MQEPPRRRALWPWLVITLVLVVAGAIGAVLAVRANSRDTTVRAVKVLTVAPAPKQPQRTSPAPDRVAASTPASAEGSLTVPDVRGQKLSDAEKAIHEAGLRADQRKVPSSLPKNTVIAQSPSPGTGAEEGDHVVLTASQGPKHKHDHDRGPKERNR
jgi:hypothetical protein